MFHLFSVLTRRRRRAQRSRLPVLDGFSEGRRLCLPPGDLIAEEGVCLLHDRLGEHVLPRHDEAWVALRLDQGIGWYALWCPHALRWEVLSFEVEHAAVPYARRRVAAAGRQRSAG
jgi:hypothetical protein